MLLLLLILFVIVVVMVIVVVVVINVCCLQERCAVPDELEPVGLPAVPLQQHPVDPLRCFAKVQSILQCVFLSASPFQ